MNPSITDKAAKGWFLGKVHVREMIFYAELERRIIRVPTVCNQLYIYMYVRSHIQITW